MGGDNDALNLLLGLVINQASRELLLGLRDEEAQCFADFLDMVCL
jgi:hypothetical protein